MTHRPRLLDAYCGAGGAAMGYHLAGFDVVGVDIHPQPRYPFEFHQGDALSFIAQHGHRFDAIHASPPCPAYSKLTYSAGTRDQHPDLVPATRAALQATGKPYAIENVPGAPLLNYVVLCGTMFGLQVLRHRLFECYPAIHFAPASCCHQKPVVKNGRRPDLSVQFHSIYGHFSGVPEARIAMGIEWMTQRELAQAIPPEYTKWIGQQLMVTL